MFPFILEQAFIPLFGTLFMNIRNLLILWICCWVSTELINYLTINCTFYFLKVMLTWLSILKVEIFSEKYLRICSSNNWQIIINTKYNIYFYCIVQYFTITLNKEIYHTVLKQLLELKIRPCNCN